MLKIGNFVADNHSGIGLLFEIFLFASSVILMTLVAISIGFPSLADTYLKDVAIGVTVWMAFSMIFMFFALFSKELYFTKEINA